MARLLDLGPQTELEFPCGLLREGHRDDVVARRSPRRDHRDDPAHERGGLAGAGRRFDYQRRAEIAANPVALIFFLFYGVHRVLHTARRGGHRIPRFARTKSSINFEPFASLHAEAFMP
jgi:hypothetical protein